MGNRKYDFAGWVTKSDIRCSDGVTIKHDAFKDNDGQKVPLVWNHNYNSPNNVLGHVLLQNQQGGVYGYGFFNDTEEGRQAKELVKNGDISAMSIGARKLKRNGSDIIHGSIYEVSLVMAGANPGAMIETVMQHSDGGEEERAFINPGTLIHSADDLIDNENLEHKAQGGETEMADEKQEKTIGDIIDAMTEEQQNAVYSLLGMVADEEGLDEDEDDDNVQQGENLEDKETTIKHNFIEGDGQTMKKNVFNQGQGGAAEASVLKHGINTILQQAQKNKVSFKDALKEAVESGTLTHSGLDADTLQHGINSIEMLFPDAFASSNGNQPILYKDPNTASEQILSRVNKSPFSKVRTTIADLTEEEARAKGYIKGNMKKEEYFSLIKRQTTPTTVYKKQKLDRDDILDITDFDVVAFMSVEMKAMLKEEVARAILVGDGRDFSAEDKIDEGNIRPVITDNDFFTIKKNFADEAAFIEAVILGMTEYLGSGNPDMYIDPLLLGKVKLLKGTDGKFLFGDIPTTQSIAARLGLNEIFPSTFMAGKGALIVNLRDYTLGATKGGEVTNFDDFDIDFNQYKYLSETRLSGALTMPKSAIHFQQGASAGTGATDTAAGMTYGTRQSDKSTTEPTA
jgi:HK97 family phage prohead protease